jgi:hypothetical protein
MRRLLAESKMTAGMGTSTSALRAELQRRAAGMK